MKINGDGKVLRGVIPYLLTLSILLVDFTTSFAAMVRGRVQRDMYPVPYVSVTLISSNPALGRSAPSVTGPDGMYYLYNVPPGQYILELWLGGPSPVRYPINVREPYTDIPPIAIQ
jgi:hypothetical protein